MICFMDEELGALPMSSCQAGHFPLRVYYEDYGQLAGGKVHCFPFQWEEPNLTAKERFRVSPEAPEGYGNLEGAVLFEEPILASLVGQCRIPGWCTGSIKPQQYFCREFAMRIRQRKAIVVLNSNSSIHPGLSDLANPRTGLDILITHCDSSPRGIVEAVEEIRRGLRR